MIENTSFWSEDDSRVSVIILFPVIKEFSKKIKNRRKIVRPIKYYNSMGVHSEVYPLVISKILLS